MIKQQVMLNANLINLIFSDTGSYDKKSIPKYHKFWGKPDKDKATGVPKDLMETFIKR